MAKYKYFTEKDLYAAAELSKYKDLAMIPPAAELKGRHTFSEAFERKIEEIYKIFDEPKRKSKIVSKVLLVAAIITFLLALAMSASALCERVYELFLTHYDDHADGFFVSVQQEDGSYIEMRGDLSVLYYPSYIPHGFKEVERFTNGSTYRRIIYTNEQGEMINFRQSVITTCYDLDNEDAEFTEIADCGITFYCTSKENGMVTIVWNQNGYAFQLICHCHLDEALAIAKSLLAE